MNMNDFKMGQGTWEMGDHARDEAAEAAALAYGIDNGLTLIDTAEMYASGGAERVVGKAMKAYPRASLFVVSKVYPYNASPRKMRDACINSLARLDTDYLDCYLLHWRGSVPLADTVAGFEALVSEGLIRTWGVSNFDVPDMEELWRIPNGANCVTNQVLYNVAQRGIEYDLLPWCQQRGVVVMAYTPLVGGNNWQRRIGDSPALQQIARRHNATIQQILLAFTMRHKGMLTIPKSAKIPHIAANIASQQITLTAEDMAQIDAAFPPPASKSRLATG